MNPEEIQHLTSGEAPVWIEKLEILLFGRAWLGPLEALEQLWMMEGQAFARWRVVPAIQEAELLRIGVHPDLQRQGRASRLLCACESSLRDQGIEWVYLEVRKSNHPAQSAYASQGWIRCGERLNYYPDGEDAWIYRKELL